MIHLATRFRIARVPLAHILLTEVQPRYPERVQHYVALLSAPANADADPGMIALAPHRDKLLAALGYYELLDGHHRVLAGHIVGRAALLAVINYQPGDHGYDEASAPLATLPLPAPTVASAA